MAHVLLEAKAIRDSADFHSACASAFGFPEFYGRNMDAWIDCLTYMREGDGMSRFVLAPGEVLVIEVADSASLPSEVLGDLVRCSAFVNRRYLGAGDEPPLQLLLR